MKVKINKYYWFTLIELLYVTIILWLLIPAITWVYSFLIKSNRDIAARQSVIQQGYEFFEKLNILMQDYTIDYEEYYNRQMVGCVWTSKRWSNFEWNIWTSWYCTNFTAYWNENSTGRRGMSSEDWMAFTDYHDIYYCSSIKAQDQQWNPIVVKNNCTNSNSSCCWAYWTKQSFWQYQNLFTDVKGWSGNIIWTSDDEELWYPLNSSLRAIRDENNIQELYLISYDWKNRLFFRRKLVNNKRLDEWDYYAQYRIQMLRLRWFDAWQKHSFDVDVDKNEWVYDNKIDTWACDTSMWFVWHWKSVWWAYSDYHLPNSADDCWVDLTYWNTTISAWNISISPLWDPDLHWAKREHQINPYMKILLVNGVYLPMYNSKKEIGSSIMEFKVPLETTINMKSFYDE